MPTTGVHIGMKIDQAKSQFFDRLLIQSPLEKAEHKFLNRAGAAVRLTSRRSIRKRKKISSPGQPPTSRTGLLKQFIFYVKDPAGNGVVVGPALLNTTQERDTLFLLEHGGQRRTRRGYWYTAGTGEQGRDKRGHFTKRSGERKYVPKGTRQNYKPRPFMGPALDKTKPRLAEFWDRAIN